MTARRRTPHERWIRAVADSHCALLQARKWCTARDVVEGILDLTRQRNVTKLIVGKSGRPRWLEVLQGSIVDELIRQSGEVDVYVIRGDAQGALADRTGGTEDDDGTHGFQYSVFRINPPSF